MEFGNTYIMTTVEKHIQNVNNGFYEKKKTTNRELTKREKVAQQQRKKREELSKSIKAAAAVATPTSPSTPSPQPSPQFSYQAGEFCIGSNTYSTTLNYDKLNSMKKHDRKNFLDTLGITGKERMNLVNKLWRMRKPKKTAKNNSLVPAVYTDDHDV